jgi:hypothetical protein
VIDAFECQKGELPPLGRKAFNPLGKFVLVIDWENKRRVQAACRPLLARGDDHAFVPFLLFGRLHMLAIHCSVSV